ncbi:MAG: hypothetical protein J3Q66DRAFT_445954 [Benniella sp.]|nr:MAG: hypothetical protein J3Q66DRAFT_445954 [Benniella sp.]
MDYSCLAGCSFGCIVVHTMAAHFERQGERVALLAVMDTVPRTLTAKNRVSMEEQDDEAQGYISDIQLFVNRLQDALPDNATPYIEKFKHTPISPDEWRPYVMGEIDVFDINCEHVEMDLAAPLAEIGGVLAERLNEIHAREAIEV